MASIIKSSKPDAEETSAFGALDVAQPSFFNASDLRQNAEAKLISAKQNAEKILEQARMEAEQIRAAARQEGLAEAQQDVQKKIQLEAHRVAESHCQSLLSSCEETMKRLQAETGDWLQIWQKQTTLLAKRMAEKIVKQHLADHQLTVLREWLSEFFQLACDARYVTVHVHPKDYAVAQSALKQIARSTPLAASTEVVEDETVELGGCRVVTEQGSVDFQISTQLERLATQLS